MTCSAYDTSASTGGQMAYNPLPAVAIGGPPHSGKSVLVYSLTQALRALDVDHYVIRAYPPDGEGDWFLEGDPETVRSFRRKGAGSEAWLAPLVRDIARRHLPLVVDLGGMPTPDQEAALDVCTHAILLVRQCMTGGALARDVAAHRVWSQRFGRHGLVLLADLDSVLDGVSVLEGDAPIITGTLAGLERGTRAEGPVLAALVSRLAGLFRAASAGLARHHLATAPVELAIDLAALARTLAIHPLAWPSEALPRVLAYLPEGEPLAVYGRGPNWLYAAIAAHAFPAPFYLFDVRCGCARRILRQACPMRARRSPWWSQTAMGQRGWTSGCAMPMWTVPRCRVCTFPTLPRPPSFSVASYPNGCGPASHEPMLATGLPLSSRRSVEPSWSAIRCCTASAAASRCSPVRRDSPEPWPARLARPRARGILHLPAS